MDPQSFLADPDPASAVFLNADLDPAAFLCGNTYLHIPCTVHWKTKINHSELKQLFCYWYSVKKNLTFVLLESLAESVNALDIEVVGGLVQHHHVRPGQGQLGQGHARLLTTRQVFHHHRVGVRLNKIVLFLLKSSFFQSLLISLFVYSFT